MPWNDNANPGPWGTPPSGEGGDKQPPKSSGPQRGGGGPRRPGGPGGPDISATLDRLIAQLRGLLGGAGGPGDGIRPGAVAAAAGAGFAIWALSGLYIVQPNEEAVVTTFGAYSRSATPGLRYHLPTPIEHVEKVAVTSLNRIDIGGTTGAGVPEESLMLTGDESIVDLQFSVTWRVANASRYVFTVRDPEDAVKSVAESAMREVVGKTPMESILTSGRGTVQNETAELMQKTLDAWGAGVNIVEVQIRTANPPQEVVAAARDVANASQDAESAVNQADAYRNRVINEAKGDAAKLTQSALGYREQSVREAIGEASRFSQILTEYKRAPGVTRDRLYIETMQRVLSRSNKVVIDGKGASAPIILPPDVFRAKTPAPRIEPQADGGQTVTPSPGAPR
ncbi:FtsH protease activity modulator HflK [soil metagenome]